MTTNRLPAAEHEIRRARTPAPRNRSYKQSAMDEVRPGAPDHDHVGDWIERIDPCLQLSVEDSTELSGK